MVTEAKGETDRLMSTIAVVTLWAFFATLLLAAIVYDVRERRVPNLLVVPLFLGGVLASVERLGAAGGLSFAIAGAGTGMLIWFPMYLLRLMGAGDVKLFAAGAAWLGWQGALAGSIGTALAGGLLGLAWLFFRRGGLAAVLALGQALKTPRVLQLKPLDRRERVPYAIAIASGLAVGWWVVMFPVLRR